jgi:hypothetical protein
VEGRGHAVVCRPFQLRRPAGHLFPLPSHGGATSPERDSAWASGLVFRPSVLDQQAFSRGALSTACAGRRPFWAVSTRGALYGWPALARSFPQLLFLRAAEGLGETSYFPARHFADQRLPPQMIAVARPGPPPDRRLHRNHRRGFLRRAHRPALPMALVVCRVWRARCSARPGPEPFSAGACEERLTGRTWVCWRRARRSGWRSPISCGS